MGYTPSCPHYLRYRRQPTDLTKGKKQALVSTVGTGGTVGSHRSPLATRVPALLRPGEVHHRREEEAVAVVSHPREAVVPREEGPKDSEEATSLGELLVRHLHLIAHKVRDTQEDQGQIDEEEQREESQGGTESQVQDHCREDDPALFLVSYYIWRK